MIGPRQSCHSAHSSTPSKDDPSVHVSSLSLEKKTPRLFWHPAPPGAKTWVGGKGHLLRRELFRFQLERRTPDKDASTGSPLLTTAGTLQAGKQCQ